MSRIDPLMVGLCAVLFVMTGCASSQGDNGLPFARLEARGALFEPVAAIAAPGKHHPQSQRRNEHVAAAKRKGPDAPTQSSDQAHVAASKLRSPEGPAQLRQQFDQFVSERARQHGADTVNDPLADKEKLFREFDLWLRERSFPF